MFFVLSKLLGVLAQPSNALLVLLCLGVLLLMLGRRRSGTRLTGAVAAVLLAVAVLPVGPWLLAPLENRFVRPDPMPDSVDGIILLGGTVNPLLSADRGEEAINGSGERITTFARLARRYPDARLVFAGGSGSLAYPGPREAGPTRTLLAAIGAPIDRIIWESDSRNTAENAAFSRALVDPQPGETWLLVTSAGHMPRSVAVFRAAGWPVIAYPTDYRTYRDSSWDLDFDLADRLVMVDWAAHEWIGLLAYWMTGRTAEIFPAPSG